jgi:hypothetical protein
VAQLYPQAPSTHFSRLLRHAWATVELFFSPVTTRSSNINRVIKSRGGDGTDRQDILDAWGRLGMRKTF